MQENHKLCINTLKFKMLLMLLSSISKFSLRSCFEDFPFFTAIEKFLYRSILSAGSSLSYSVKYTVEVKKYTYCL